MPTPRRNGKPWTHKELKRLREFVLASKSDTEIGELLGRSRHAVHCKRKYTLGIDYRKHWTGAEDARLRTLLATTDIPISEIAKRLNRTESSVERRKEKLKIHRVPFKLDKSNPLHAAQLIKFRMAGWTLAQIANIWGVKYSNQISNVLRSKGFYNWAGKRERERWSEVEVQLLRKYLKKGMSLESIYREFPHQLPGSIARQIRKITKYWRSPEARKKDEQQREKWMKWRVY